MIECMCVACHGPLAGRSITCSVRCRSEWNRQRAGRGPLPKYVELQMLQAYRRDLEAVRRELQARLAAAGWLDGVAM